MQERESKPRIIDSHQHYWSPSERPYSWIGPGLEALARDFTPADFSRESAGAGITGTVLVQAADSYEDTFAMLRIGRHVPSVLGVVGWVPLDRPEEAEEAVRTLASSRLFRGVRALTHTYTDDAWLSQSRVSASLGILDEMDLSLDVVAGSPAQLATIVDVARSHPDLAVIIDHLGSPPVAPADWKRWRSLMGELAALPRTAVKVSGLSALVENPRWGVDALMPSIEAVVDLYGTDRMMIGSDWPVSVLNGGFARTWSALMAVVDAHDGRGREDLLNGTARRVYKLTD